MKRLLLIMIIIMSISNIEVDGQIFYKKWKIKRSVKILNNGNYYKAKRKITSLKPKGKWDKKYIKLYNYFYNISYLSKYQTIFKQDSLIVLRKNKEILDSLVMDYVKFNSDTIWLNKKGFDISKFRLLRNDINDQIQYLIERKRILIENDSLKNQIKLKREYETPPLLDSLADIILPKIIDLNKVSKLEGAKQTEYLIEIKRDGELGKDLIVKLSLYYEDKLYGYPKGIYRSKALDYPIKIFSSIIKENLQKKSIAKVNIIGEADANVPNGLEYDGFYGNITETNYEIYKGAIITNQQLAYLRAYNGKKLFEEITGIKVQSIKAIDHIPYGNKGVKFRKITMTAYLLDYFTEKFNKLSKEAKDNLNIEIKTIKIKNDDIVK